jgi:hypothetical protein
MDWSTNLQMLTTGLAMGSIYALVALGFALIFNAVNVEGSLAPHLTNLQGKRVVIGVGSREIADIKEIAKILIDEWKYRGSSCRHRQENLCD